MHKIIITPGKYPREYQASVYKQVTIWRFSFWRLLYRRLGPLTYMQHVANEWSWIFKCEITTKTNQS